MHGSDKPVVGDLVFDTALADKKADDEDHEMNIDGVEENVQDKADVEEPGLSNFFSSSIYLEA